MNNAISKIYITDNYSLFRKLNGNRSVSERHKNELVRLIKADGYTMSPIKVNSHMEVVDGQHRLAALKELGLPVQYYIDPNATATDCDKQNRGQKNWDTMDRIKARADLGDVNYKLLLCLMQAHPSLRKRDLISLAMTPVNFRGAVLNGTAFQKEFVFTADHYTWADRIATNFEPFFSLIKGMNVNKFAVIPAVLFVLTIPDIDIDRLMNILQQRRTVRTDGTIMSAIEELDSLYNKKLSVNRINFIEAFKSKDHLRQLEDEWTKGAKK